MTPVNLQLFYLSVQFAVVVVVVVVIVVVAVIGWLAQHKLCISQFPPHKIHVHFYVMRAFESEYTLCKIVHKRERERDRGKKTRQPLCTLEAQHKHCLSVRYEMRLFWKMFGKLGVKCAHVCVCLCLCVFTMKNYHRNCTAWKKSSNYGAGCLVVASLSLNSDATGQCGFWSPGNKSHTFSLIFFIVIA